MKSSVIKAVLSAKFPQLIGKSIDALTEVIEYTPNPEVALESLLGVYEEPIIPSQSLRYGNVTCTAIRYNKYAETVSYSYEKPKRVHKKHDYISAKEAQAALDNGTFVDGESNYDWLDSKELETIVEDSMSLEDWNKNAIHALQV